MALLVGQLWMPEVVRAVVIDRIAIVSGDSIVKDSDIERELRVTEFLNNQPLDDSVAARRASAKRLLEQTFIRKEIRTGDYARATPQDARKQLAALEKRRFHTRGAMQNALTPYGIEEADVETQLQWQLTVLNFIEQRFKPAATPSPFRRVRGRSTEPFRRHVVSEPPCPW